MLGHQALLVLGTKLAAYAQMQLHSYEYLCSSLLCADESHNQQHTTDC